MEPKKIGVVGAGTMGNGISQALAAAGIDVVMTDVAPIVPSERSRASAPRPTSRRSRTATS